MLLLSRTKQEWKRFILYQLAETHQAGISMHGAPGGGVLLEQNGNYYPDSDIYLYFFFKARPFDTKWSKGPDTE